MQIVEFTLEELSSLILGGLTAIKLFNVLGVFLFQTVDNLVGTVRILLV